VRLDWSDDELKWHPTTMSTPEPKVDELIQCIRRHTPYGARFRHGYHINIQQVLACVLEAHRRGLEGQRDLRIVFILDSTVAIGAISTGRPSSRSLNQAVSQWLCVFLRFGIRVVPVWVSTKCNPSDAPSRDAPLPLPLPVPQWAQHLFKHHGQTGRQIDLHLHMYSPRRIPKEARQVRHYHAGVGGLSAALLRVGFDCRSFDPYVRGRGEYTMAEDLELDSIANLEIKYIRAGVISYWHSGIPCSSWSILQTLSKKSTRAKQNPWGTGDRKHERRANTQLRQLLRIIRASLDTGCFFSIEQPRTSLMLSTPEMLACSIGRGWC